MSKVHKSKQKNEVLLTTKQAEEKDMFLEVKPAERKHKITVKAMIVDLLYFKTTKFECVLVTSSNNGEIRFWKHT